MAGAFVRMLLVTCILIIMVKESQAACCTTSVYGYCMDCTGATPYCGHGPCNIFGCSCEGGSCRRNCSPAFENTSWWGYSCTCRNKRELPDHAADGTEENKGVDPRGVFDALDANGDGRLSKEEIEKALPEISDAVAEALKEMDKNNNGEIDPDEFDEDLK